ncbi:MAG: Orotate phosphoribosyltransferase [Candidatus Kapaibacterium sp.]|nr:MAG: Orotate phosphoribosyltransferase [Candidatus Kapabacteria bacterium]
MTRKELGKEIYKVSLLRGEFRLRSGILSNEYFDKYQFESDPKLLREIAKGMINFLPNDFDLIAGLETGGIPLATAIALEINKPIVFVRKKAKEYGTMKLAEGPNVQGMKVVVIEDVVTSGGQIIKSIEDLRNLGAICNLALCVIDREQGGKENLAKIGIELRSLFTISEIKSFNK